MAFSAGGMCLCFLLSGNLMSKHKGGLDWELRRGVQYTAKLLTLAPGAFPVVPGIDIYGITIPFNGMAGGDLITYVNFQDRFDLDARVGRATANGQDNMAQLFSD
jgi:hypothetical protein